MGSTCAVKRVSNELDRHLTLEEPAWAGLAEGDISHFHPQSSRHRPRTRFRIGYGTGALFVRFDVADRYVRAVSRAFQDQVCKDSCVEFFVRPREDRGYFNFEMSCGGTLLAYCIEDPTRTPSGFARYRPLTSDEGSQLEILHSLPPIVEPEITQPVTWSLACRIPLHILEPHVGALGSLKGQRWTGNFFKCGDNTSHPHWAAWNPIGQDLNFHQPGCFGDLHFE